MRPILSIDIETTGLDPWRDEILMCGLWDGESYYCLRHGVDLRVHLSDVYPDYDLLGHKTDFDIKFLKVKGWLTDEDLKGRTIHDSRIMGSLLRERVPKAFLDQYEIARKEENKKLPVGVSHRQGSFLSLKVMAPWYLKVPPFWETPGDHDNEEYNQKDCMYPYRMFFMFKEKLAAEGSWDFYLRMLRWQQMITEMEIKGITISMEELDKVEQEYIIKRDQMKAKLDEMWASAKETYYIKLQDTAWKRYMEMASAQIAKGRDATKTVTKYSSMAAKFCSNKIEPFNYASPTQMSWLLKDYLGLDIVNPDGDESTGKAVLNKLAQDREDIKTYLAWREADKVLTMYVPTYRELQIGSTIHPNFNLTGTRTGRTSSSSPNLQQVPSKLYRLFRPRSGMAYLQYDLSGIEAALIALYSGDKTLYDILEKGESIHDHNAKAMFNLDCEITAVASTYPRERKTVKNIGFACFYGAGWRRISQVFATGGFPISDQEAKEKLKLLKSYYPKAFEFHKEITEVFEEGQTVKNLFGRPITLQAHDNAFMQGFNTLIQSSASDLNLYAAEKYGGNILLLIHDFIMAEEKTEDAEDKARHLRECMTDFKLESEHGLIKIRTEGEVNDHWVA